MSKVNSLSYSEELFKKHYGQVVSIIVSEMRGVDLDAANLTFDDLLQESKIIFLYALGKFDDTKGAKFNTYLNMILRHRLGPIRERILNKRRKGIEVRFADLYKGNDYEDVDVDSAYDKVSFKVSTENSIDFMIDLKNKLNSMSDKHKFIYGEFFIKQKNITEIIRENKQIKYNELKSILVELKDINECLFGE